MRPAEEPADAESDGGGGVGPGLDRVAQDVFDGYGSRADAFGRFARRILGLAVEPLGASLRLVQNPLHFPFGIACHAAEAFLDFSADLPGSSRDSMLVHDVFSSMGITSTRSGNFGSVRRRFLRKRRGGGRIWPAASGAACRCPPRRRL